MPRDRHSNYRFSSGPSVIVAAGLVIAAIVGLVIVVIVTGGNGFAVGLLIILMATTIIGLILERLDRSRKRQPGSEDSPEGFWGFRGRPGS